MGVGLEEQQQLLEQLTASMQSASTAVGKAAREEGKVKLGRAMKDVYVASDVQEQQLT